MHESEEENKLCKSESSVVDEAIKVVAQLQEGVTVFDFGTCNTARMADSGIKLIK